MTIIKQGNIPKLESLKFKCIFCSCEFTTNKYSCTVDCDNMSFAADNKMQYIRSLTTKCPCCGCDIEMQTECFIPTNRKVNVEIKDDDDDEWW